MLAILQNKKHIDTVKYILKTNFLFYLVLQIKNTYLCSKDCCNSILF